MTSAEFPGKEWISRLPVRVAPAWYQHRWFWLLFGIASALLIAVGGQRRLRKERRNRAHLQSMVEVRTMELQNANERLVRLADEDSLTGLLSRRWAFEKLAELHARRRRAGEMCELVAERLAQALRSQPVFYANRRIEVRASFGLAKLSVALGVKTRLARADDALYRAKEGGRDRVSVWG